MNTPAAAAKKSGLRELVALLASPQLRRLFLARNISVMGDMMVPVALAFAVLQLTGSASDLGIILAARALPAVAFLLYGGALGDRYPRRLIMVSAQLVAAAAQLAVGVLILAKVQNIGVLAVLVAVRGATSAFFNPASTAAITVAADPARRQQTFSMFSLVGSLSEVSGPALAGALLIFLNPGWVLVLDAVTFLVSAALIFRCGNLGEGTARSGNAVPVFLAMRQGMRFVRGTPWLAALIVSAAAFQFSLLSSLNVLGPLVAEKSLGGASAWALVLTAMGFGGVVGSWLGLHIRTRYPLRLGYSVMLVGAGPTLLLLAIPAPLPLIIVSEFVAGVVITVFGTLENTAVSQHVPQELLSRVDSINRFGSMGLRPLGMAAVAPISEIVGLRPTLIGAAIVALSAMLAPLALAQVRDLTQAPQGSARIEAA
jgi:predicted MFS family arabinose efflux permease